MKTFSYVMGLIAVLGTCMGCRPKRIEPVKPEENTSSIYDISIRTLDSSALINLSDYKGKYLVIVNTASECGYTYQYKDLQEFYSKYKDSGVAVIGCPCNQFGGQEPGTAEEIGSFCQKNYGVTFPLSEKIDVKGEHQHPLYQWLTQKQKNGVADFEVSWNFNKFIISPEGKLVQYFGSKVKPGDYMFLKAVNK